jgi:hypothetical protein
VADKWVKVGPDVDDTDMEIEGEYLVGEVGAGFWKEQEIMKQFVTVTLTNI